MPNSQQLNQRANPYGYQTKRTSYAAPVTGLYTAWSLGPRTFAASAAPAGAVRIDLPTRPAALCWSTSSIDGGVSTAVLRVFMHTAATGGTPATPSLTNANIELVTSPSGVLYFKDTTASNFMVERTGTANGSNTSPHMHGQSITAASHLKISMNPVTGGTVFDLYIWLLCWTTDFLVASQGGVFKALPPSTD